MVAARKTVPTVTWQCARGQTENREDFPRPYTFVLFCFLIFLFLFFLFLDFLPCFMLTWAIFLYFLYFVCLQFLGFPIDRRKRGGGGGVMRAFQDGIHGL